ncbi:hypothetical protein F5Y04DRAFT_279817 [Hypomontagnella monticulosa]|nr:hypothetical protein F5Y04DRAFT_279817 [Hypomontagnella monticulosa]
MLFIVSSNVSKADPATRKLIRSHARRGKTKRKIRPPEDQRETNDGTVAGRARMTRVKLEEFIESYIPLMPGRIGSDIYFVEFADGIGPSTLVTMAHVTTVISGIVFPLRAAIGFQSDNRGWDSPFGRDAASLHITTFAAQGFIDRVLNRQESITNPEAILHFHKGLKLLRERLLGDDDEIKISDSTMSIVLKLASIAHFDGNYEIAKQHMDGLRKMVDLRGGLDVFRGTSLLVEMLRYDLGIALLNGSDPLFFKQPSEPVFSYPEQLLPSSEDNMHFQDNAQGLQTMDDHLIIAWLVMRKFCLLVDLGAQTRRSMKPEIIYETMSAVMYRLLYMKFPDGSIDEIVRLGLLAFSHHVFLQWQDIKLPYRHFTDRYQSGILRLTSMHGISSQLMLWLLMAGAISFFEVADEQWLKEHMQEHLSICQVKTWKGMQDILKSFMWIALLDDQLGESIYDSLRLI